MAYKYSKALNPNNYSQKTVILIVTVLVMVFGGITYINNRHSNPIPRSILSQVHFAIIYPGNTDLKKVEKNSVKYDSQNKVFTYIYKDAGLSITFTEQTTPEAFIDVPAAYTKLTDSMNTYASFDSYYGKVALTKPKQFNGDQTAVLNSRGTLVFAHATYGSWSRDQWIKFANDMQVVR